MTFSTLWIPSLTTQALYDFSKRKSRGRSCYETE
uniref:Uncharacterized protein n=1 Tax=Anguilla anguilla TaxID=7936 RepID=A0A0E9QMZ9_ANGAN